MFPIFNKKEMVTDQILIVYYFAIFNNLLTGSTSQIITVISLEPVASLRPSGENLQYHTSSQ